MIKKAILSFVLMTAALSVLAASWDSDANIDKAIDQAVSVYQAGGIDGLVTAGKNCYAGLDTSRKNPYAARDVEYCIALEITAAMIDEANRPAYFRSEEVIPRGIQYLEKAHVITLPEQTSPYFQRFKYIRKNLPSKL